MKTLVFHNVRDLRQISPCLFYTELCNIEFTSLTKLGHHCQCNLQTKQFESTQQLVDSMKSINSNLNFLNSVNDLHFLSKINGQNENINVQEQECYFNQVCDILSQWIENGNINVRLDFKINIPNRNYTDYQYCEKLAICLCKKIDGDGKTECVQLLKEFNFESPHYGGDRHHFYNAIIVNDRVRIATHMQNASSIRQSLLESTQIHFVIQLMKMNQSSQGNKKLIDCKCPTIPTVIELDSSDVDTYNF